MKSWPHRAAVVQLFELERPCGQTSSLWDDEDVLPNHGLQGQNQKKSHVHLIVGDVPFLLSFPAWIFNPALYIFVILVGHPFQIILKLFENGAPQSMHYCIIISHLKIVLVWGALDNP